MSSYIESHECSLIRVSVEIAKGIDRRLERDRNGSYGREYGGGSSSRSGGRSE